MPLSLPLPRLLFKSEKNIYTRAYIYRHGIQVKRPGFQINTVKQHQLSIKRTRWVFSLILQYQSIIKHQGHWPCFTFTASNHDFLTRRETTSIKLAISFIGKVATDLTVILRSWRNTWTVSLRDLRLCQRRAPKLDGGATSPSMRKNRESKRSVQRAFVRP